jgi:hypothetical protein
MQKEEETRIASPKFERGQADASFGTDNQSDSEEEKD